MTGSLRALLGEVIDYAGLFPPARLPLDEAWQNYLRYRGTQESWMLARFVCPTHRLMEVFELAGESARGIRFSAIGQGGADAVRWPMNVMDDFEAIRKFCKASGAVVDSYEVKLPPGMVNSFTGDAMLALAGTVADARSRGGGPLTCFFEFAPTDDWQKWTPRLAAALAEHNRGPRGRDWPMGFKLRTGGTEAAAFPSVAHVAEVLMTCRDEDCFWKATAGLHHPLRRRDEDLDVTMHGFLNVLVADVLARTHDLYEATLSSILSDTDPASFRFDDDGLAWRDFSATIDAIRAARRNSLRSFGSCSFDEPRADLTELGLLSWE